MQLDVQYYGRSGIVEGPSGRAMRFSPNLARKKVFFDGELKKPLRFREAISALHDVVIGDLKFKKKDKAAYEEWKKQEAIREEALKNQVIRDAKARALESLTDKKVPADLEEKFKKMHRLYWDARIRWANELSRNDPELFRHLVPCDPVVTVAPDVVYFECFSKDESSYGCLSVDRDAFAGLAASSAGLGTTNVDYSIALYEHFQTLRTYRPTRLTVDPSGFEVKVDASPDYREEKIDLPSSWLRGFGQIQGAMALPSKKIEISTEAIYSVLAYLKRHREKTGPRSIRFVLEPGRPPVLVLDPWDVRIVSRGALYAGDKKEEIKIWGRRRLFSFARVLPLAERFEVRLLGSGLPSIWIAHLGEMRMTLALSGWTTNDWTSGTNLELLAGTYRSDPKTADVCARVLINEQRATLEKLSAEAATGRDLVLGSLFKLARQGQVIYDHGASLYRWREVMPVALSETLLGPEPPELGAGKELARIGALQIVREEDLPNGRRLFVAKADKTSCEAIMDADGVFQKARCTCKHHHTYGLRAGPCRHLLALRIRAQGQVAYQTWGGGAPETVH
jgi:hypothetical protein